MKNNTNQLLNDLVVNEGLTINDIAEWLVQHPEVINSSIWTKEDIFDYFFKPIVEDVLDDLKPSDSDHKTLWIKQLWLEFFEDCEHLLRSSELPSEWGSPYDDAVYYWLETKKGIEV